MIAIKFRRTTTASFIGYFYRRCYRCDSRSIGSHSLLRTIKPCEGILDGRKSFSGRNSTLDQRSTHLDTEKKTEKAKDENRETEDPRRQPSPPIAVSSPHYSTKSSSSSFSSSSGIHRSFDAYARTVASRNQVQRILRRLPLGSTTHSFYYNELSDNVKIDLTQLALCKAREEAFSSTSCKKMSSHRERRMEGSKRGALDLTTLVSLSEPEFKLSDNSLEASFRAADKARRRWQGKGENPQPPSSTAANLLGETTKTKAANVSWQEEDAYLFIPTHPNSSSSLGLQLFNEIIPLSTTFTTCTNPAISTNPGIFSPSTGASVMVTTTNRAYRQDYAVFPLFYVLMIPDELLCEASPRAFLQERLFFDELSRQLIYYRPKVPSSIFSTFTPTESPGKAFEEDLTAFWEEQVVFAQTYTFDALFASRAAAMLSNRNRSAPSSSEGNPEQGVEEDKGHCTDARDCFSSRYRIFFITLRSSSLSFSSSNLCSAALQFPSCFVHSVVEVEAGGSNATPEPSSIPNAKWPRATPIALKRLRIDEGGNRSSNNSIGANLWSTQISPQGAIGDSMSSPISPLLARPAGEHPNTPHISQKDGANTNADNKSIIAGAAAAFARRRGRLVWGNLASAAGEERSELSPPFPLSSSSHGAREDSSGLSSRRRLRRCVFDVVEALSVGADSSNKEASLAGDLWRVLIEPPPFDQMGVLPTRLDLILTARERVLIPFLCQPRVPFPFLSSSSIGGRMTNPTAVGGKSPGVLWRLGELEEFCGWRQNRAVFESRVDAFDHLIGIKDGSVVEVGDGDRNSPNTGRGGVLLPYEEAFVRGVLLPAMRAYARDPPCTSRAENAVGLHHRELSRLLRFRLAKSSRSSTKRRGVSKIAVAVIPIREFIASTITSPSKDGDGGFHFGRHDLARCLEYFAFFDRFFDIACGDRTTVGFIQ